MAGRCDCCDCKCNYSCREKCRTIWLLIMHFIIAVSSVVIIFIVKDIGFDSDITKSIAEELSEILTDNYIWIL